MRTVVALLVTVVAAVLFVPSAGAVSGELRVLYVLATWGPTPFSTAEADQVAAETDAFFRASSFGRLSMPGSVAAAPVRLSRAVFDSCDATVLRNASPASTFAGVDRIVFVTPLIPACNFAGEANPTEVLLNGELYMTLAAHELGHTLGLGHASRYDCAGASCSISEYGSEFSLMGGGGGDFNAYEKAGLEWLTGGVVRPTGNATHELGPIEEPTALPQAFVVTTAASEFWFESRGRPTPSFLGTTEQPAGVAVIAGPANGAFSSPHPRENLLLPNPRGGRRFAYTTGESFARAGVFRVTVERHAPESATLRFEWLDRVAPGRPLVDARPERGRVRLGWDPAPERGSGVLTYTVLVDGRAVRRVDGQVPYINANVTLRLPRGLHRVGVLATDRAGNRGRATSVRVRAR